MLSVGRDEAGQVIGEKGKKFLAWLWVGLCSLAIFFVVPFARAIQKFTVSHFGEAFFRIFVLASIALAFVLILYALIVRLKIRALPNYFWLFLCAFVYVFETLRLPRNSPEVLHFWEYGLLGYLLFRALRFSIQDKTIYGAAFLLGTWVGIIDEILQWITPIRYWDIRDVGFNMLAVGLLQIALWKGVRPKLSSARIPARSIRLVSIIFSLNLLLFGLCMSNSPQRLEALIARFPALSSLAKEEPMREYILKHRDPGIGTFYSRLTIAWLQKIDRQYADEYARDLNDWKDKDYNDFLKLYKTVDYPFLHEMRVHLFRRDRRYAAGSIAAATKTQRSEYFIAWKENRILEKYFWETLRRSVYLWDEKRTSEVESLIDKSAPYDSPVSKNVFYWLKEGPMWAAILLILGLLTGFNLALARRRR